ALSAPSMASAPINEAFEQDTGAGADGSAATSSALSGTDSIALPPGDNASVRIGIAEAFEQPSPTNVPAGAGTTANAGADLERGTRGLGGDGYASSSAPVAAAHNRPPRYPSEAQLRGIEGTVVLSVQVRADGRVAGASVARSSGSDLLDDAAIN